VYSCSGHPTVGGHPIEIWGGVSDLITLQSYTICKVSQCPVLSKRKKIGLISVRTEKCGASCDQGNETARSSKGREFFRAAKRIFGLKTGLCSTELVTHHNYLVPYATVRNPIKLEQKARKLTLMLH